MGGRLGAAAVVLAMFALAGFAQTFAQTNAKGRSYTLHGTVENVNPFAQSIRVKQEKIEGYSEARVATYGVDDPSILKKIEAGDRIVATIFEKDDILHNIRVAQFLDSPLPHEKPK